MITNSSRTEPFEEFRPPAGLLLVEVTDHLDDAVEIFVADPLMRGHQRAQAEFRPALPDHILHAGVTSGNDEIARDKRPRFPPGNSPVPIAAAEAVFTVAPVASVGEVGPARVGDVRAVGRGLRYGERSKG